MSTAKKGIPGIQDPIEARYRITELARSGVKFRNVVEFPCYKVSNNGVVISCQRIGRYGKSNGSRGPWRIMQQHYVNPKLGKFHLYVFLSRDLQNFHRLVHRLVLESFVGPCPSGLECRHLDGNPTNNNISNLIWGTRTENNFDTVRHGKHASPKGIQHCRAKLSEEDVREIRRLYSERMPLAELGRRYRMTAKGIEWIVRRRTWKHIGD